MPILGIMASQISGHLGPAYPYLAYDSIQTVTVSGSSTFSISFTSIPSTYTHLQIRGIGAVNRTAAFTGGTAWTFNGDTAANYSSHNLYGYNSVASTGSSVSISSMGLADVGTINASVQYWSPTVIDILDYANTNKYKTARAFTGMDNGTATGEIDFYSANWRSTSAITTITMTVSTFNLLAGTTYALYGIK